MNIRRIAAAASFATGAALAFAPLALADSSSDAASVVDSLISGVSPADTTPINLDISFDGYTLYDGMGTADATTISGQFGLAIAYGDGASATAEGGTGDYALASGNDAIAHAGSMTMGATGYNSDYAEDIGNNTAGGPGAPDGAYAGGGSLLTGGTDSATASSNNYAIDIGNNGPDAATGDGGNSGAFAGDGQLIGLGGGTAGSGDTAYTFGSINGENGGSAAVDGTNNFANTSGNETGDNEGAFAGIGNNNSAVADTNYTTTGDGVSAIGGNNNIAYVDGPTNSTAAAGGTSSLIGEATHVGSNNIAYVADPFGTMADSANAGSSSTAAGSNDLAEVLLTHGNAAAQGGSSLYDILSLFGNFHSASLPAAADAAAVDAAAVPITSTVSSEVASANSLFQTEALFAGVPSTDYVVGPQGFDIINGATDIAKDAPASGTPTALDYELFGVKPFAAGVAGDPGAFNLFNGAEVRFDDAYNVALYAAENQGALDPTAADFFGSLPSGFATDTAAQAFESFYNSGIGDLSGFFQTDLSSLDISAATATSLFDLFDPSAAASLF